MNYDQVIDKLKQIEETVDIILLTSQPGIVKVDEALYRKAARLRERAAKRQARRDYDDAAREEYWKLKRRINEIEAEHPSVVNTFEC